MPRLTERPTASVTGHVDAAVSVEIDDREIGQALLQLIIGEVPPPQPYTVFLRLYTDGDAIYTERLDKSLHHIMTDRNIARLVDAHNVLSRGHPLHVGEEALS